jgi:glucokinase
MRELFIGVDVGGTTVKLGICDADGNVHGRGSVATDPAASPTDMLEQIAVVARKLVADAGATRACGVGTPGPLDPERRVLARANHLPTWKDVAIPRILGSQLGIPVVLENDGNCAAWGESCVGVGRGARAIVLFTLGTGVGGGIVLDGELWAGVGGAAGAFGHLVIDPAGPLCLCGQRGCLEVYASATSVARRAGRKAATDAFSAAESGDAAGQAAVTEACDALAAAIATTIHTLQPDVVILGGGMAAAGDALLLPVREGVRRRVRPAWLEHTRIELASLRGDAGWIGAALWAAHATSAAHNSSPHTITTRKDRDAR